MKYQQWRNPSTCQHNKLNPSNSVIHYSNSTPTKPPFWVSFSPRVVHKRFPTNGISVSGVGPRPGDHLLHPGRMGPGRALTPWGSHLWGCSSIIIAPACAALTQPHHRYYMVSTETYKSSGDSGKHGYLHLLSNS